MTADFNNKNILLNQNRYLPIVLWLFPLLLLNIGWWVFSYIDYRWIKTDWIEQSNQDAELLSASSDFNYCVGKISGNFFTDLKSGIESFSGVNQKEQLNKYIGSRANYIFRYPFPKHNLFVFKLLSNNKKTELIYSNTDKIISRAALSKTFEYLVRINNQDDTFSDEAKNSGAKITNNFLGGETDPSVMAETQRGKVSYSIYQYRPHFFIWDYILDKKSGDMFGFFLLIENSKETDAAGRLIALREQRYLQKNKDKSFLAAFIPLFAGYGGVVASEDFSKIPEYKTFIKEWVPRNIEKLSDWEFKPISIENEKTKVGKYQAFFHLTNGQSHAAVLLKPMLDKLEMPFWLYLLNIFIIGIIVLLLFRGFLLGIWPNISLKIRFITTYFLAACMPLGLLIITSYAYVSEYRHSAIFNDQSRLRSCINQFDIRKTLNQEEYKTAFLEIINDPLFLKYLKQFDVVNQAEPHGFPPEAKAVLRRALEILKKDNRYLPIMGITILDERGNYFSNYGNKECSTFKIYEDGKEFVESDKEFSSKNFPSEELKIKKSNEKSIEVVLYSFLVSLRKKISEIAPKTKKWTKEYNPTWIQKIAMGGYKNARGVAEASLTEELVNRRNIAISRLVGNKIISSIYDNILIDEIPRFTIYMQWDVSDLDEKSFMSSLHYFALKEPNFEFTSYEKNPLETKPWKNLERHSRGIEKVSKRVADQAYLNNYGFESDDKMTVIAVPSMKYNDKIIVGSVSHEYLKLPVFKRLMICLFIIVFALITLLVCIYFSSKIFIKPIGKLKNVLDKVAEGNLDIEIKTDSKDEFGIMCHEFSDMTRELSERNKLATLLSDHAVEALSKNEEDGGAISDVETFKGTALVTDIRNFTGMCEKYNPEQITDLLNKHFAFMTKIFSANGGRIYKYIGDAIEVVFSDNDDFEKNSTERAFVAAVEMLNTLREINFERKKKNLFEYKIGIGLCYSTMASGSIGSIDTRLDYAILGDALKNATKLESFSKLNPELPLIVDGQFISIFNKNFKNISFSFIKNENGLEGFKIQNLTLDKLLKLINVSKFTDSDEVEFWGKKDNTSEKGESQVESFEIKESISFWGKFLSGFIFIIFFMVVLFMGFYFVDKTEKESKKLEFITNSQRTLEQIRSDDYGKIAFDNKCRIIAKSLQDKINLLEKDEMLSDDMIIRVLDDSYKSDNSIIGLGLNKVFVRIGDVADCKNLITNYAAFFDSLPVYPIATSGYTEEEIKKVCDTVKILFIKEKYSDFAYEAINDYENFIDILPIYPQFIRSYIKQFIEKSKATIVSNLKIEFLRFLRDNYGEPCREVFGDKVTVFLLDYDMQNGTRDATIRNEDGFLFNLDYYINKNKIGYLFMSMPAKNAYNSVPLILSSFFNKEENVIAINKRNGECFFSENIPLFIKEKINQICFDNNMIKTEKKVFTIKDYLCSLNDIIFGDENKYDNNVEFKINNDFYDIFIFELNSKEKYKKDFKYFFILLFGIVLLYVFINTINGTSRITHSIPAKLWLTLLIVAVIPVITVFFVFSLYKSEFLSVEKSQKRDEMQRLMISFEGKKEFSYPLVWHDINRNYSSDALDSYIRILNNKSNSDDSRKKALANLRTYFKKMIDNNNKSAKVEQISKDIISCHISNVSIRGKAGWSFCSSDNEKEDSFEDKEIDFESFEKKEQENTDKIQSSSNTVSYLDDNVGEQDDTFGIMLKMVVKFLMNRQSGGNAAPKSLKDTATDEIAIGTSLEIVKAFFGEDTFIKISHGINIPIIFNIGFGKFGLMISSYPNFKNPEAVFVWLVIIETIDYLKDIQDKIETDIKIFINESFRYGTVAENTKDNNLRIPLGKYMSWLSSSFLPISTSIQLNDGNYLVECAPALTQINSIFVMLASEKDINDKINNKVYIFWVLLIISLFIIIITTKNIADDIINPVKALIIGIKEVNRENFSFRINSDRTDELGALCLSFDKMIKGLDEKRMMSRMISNTARMVTLDEGTVTFGKTDAVLLYIGIPDFSKVMDSLGEFEVFDLLKKHTAVMAGIIMEEGGEVDKIIGEKMLAVFRVNNNPSEIALAAYRVATRMLELERTNQLSFSIAIGLNYGNVINGFLGVGNKRDFTVIGDPVNVSARIESLAECLENNRCVISETFYKLVNNSVNATVYGEVELKGKSQPMKVYQLS